MASFRSWMEGSLFGLLQRAGKDAVSLHESKIVVERWSRQETRSSKTRPSLFFVAREFGQ